jgi:hypothetical protein
LYRRLVTFGGYSSRAWMIGEAVDVADEALGSPYPLLN